MLKAVCGRDEAKLKAFADKWGYESTETDWRKLIERKDIDAIDICTPNNSHTEIAIAAAQAGKMVLCEKPLSMDAAEGEEMVRGDREGRRAEHRLVQLPPRARPSRSPSSSSTTASSGKIFHYRANFLQDWTITADLPQGGAGLWRLDAEAAGSGVTGDLLAHCIDTALWLNGSITDVSAMTETFIKERKHTLTGKVEKVRIDDACTFLGRFDNGSLGALRIAPATPAATRRSTRFEINGENASIKWDLHDLHRLQYFDYSDEGIVRGWRSRSTSPTATSRT